MFRPIALRSVNRLVQRVYGAQISLVNMTLRGSRSFQTFGGVYQQQEQTKVAATQVSDLLPLKFEQDIYATIKIHNRSYLVTEGDTVILPFRLKEAEVGDVLDIYNVTTLGSRNYTVVGEPIDKSLYSIKATVIEKTKNPLYIKEVTKRRNRHVRHIPVQHDKTILRISELKI